VTRTKADAPSNNASEPGDSDCE
jgi:hypothetical protein